MGLMQYFEVGDLELWNGMPYRTYRMATAGSWEGTIE
jgi:hypothetical protein